MIPLNFSHIRIAILPVGQLTTNCYLLIDKTTDETIIVDPGDDADYIERVISDLHVTQKSILATHGHFDHIMAAFELQAAYSIPFLVHKNDEFLVKDLRNRVKHWLHIESPPPPIISGYLVEKQIISLGDTEFTVLETPGHTPGGICLYSAKEKVLFVGDLIFTGNVYGRTDFSYSNKNDLILSIKKILKLPENTTVFSGHEEQFFLSDYTFTG